MSEGMLTRTNALNSSSTAVRSAGDGAVVTFSFAHDEPAARAVVTAVDDRGGSARAVRCDLADGGQIVDLFDRAEEHGGGLDIVVNNAALARTGLIAQTSDEQYDE